MSLQHQVHAETVVHYFKRWIDLSIQWKYCHYCSIYSILMTFLAAYILSISVSINCQRNLFDMYLAESDFCVLAKLNVING